jgi:peptidoglycan/LPS O-acetylase OafA/YrhL
MLVFCHHAFAHYLEHTHRLGTQSLPRDWALIYPRSPLVSWGLDLAFGVPLFGTISGFVLSIPFSRSGIKGAPSPTAPVAPQRRAVLRHQHSDAVGVVNRAGLRGPNVDDVQAGA